ncbi:hypothetical protein CXF70_05480 [Planomicrobium sp. MB-3u-38]|nr:hypothetical protein CXF70_05480 [Planomicrobium sp. MB-3u-38]
MDSIRCLTDSIGALMDSIWFVTDSNGIPMDSKSIKLEIDIPLHSKIYIQKVLAQSAKKTN